MGKIWCEPTWIEVIWHPKLHVMHVQERMGIFDLDPSPSRCPRDLPSGYQFNVEFTKLSTDARTAGSAYAAYYR